MTLLQWRGRPLPDPEVLSPRALQWDNDACDAWNLQLVRMPDERFRASCVLWCRGTPVIVEGRGATQQMALDVLAAMLPVGFVGCRGGEA